MGKLAALAIARVVASFGAGVGAPSSGRINPIARIILRRSGRTRRMGRIVAIGVGDRFQRWFTIGVENRCQRGGGMRWRRKNWMPLVGGRPRRLREAMAVGSDCTPQAHFGADSQSYPPQILLIHCVDEVFIAKLLEVNHVSHGGTEFVLNEPLIQAGVRLAASSHCVMSPIVRGHPNRCSPVQPWSYRLLMSGRHSWLQKVVVRCIHFVCNARTFRQITSIS